MAAHETIQNLKKYADMIGQVDLRKLKRTQLGEESLGAELEPRLEKIHHLKNFAIQYADEVHDNAVNQMASHLSQIEVQMAQQADRNNQEFIANKSAFLTSIDSMLEAAKSSEPFFITAAVKARGFLEDEGIRQEYQRTVENMKEEARSTLAEVKSESARAVEEAKTLAKQIEAGARRTAAGVSVEEAQRQFGLAQGDLTTKVKRWGMFSILSTIATIGTAFALFYVPLPVPEDSNWALTFYHSTLRIVILSVVGGLATFCFRVLRAYMNMLERNLHRQRVANSIEAFVNSAATAEVRDFILAQLVEAVAAFGVSGLLTRERDVIGPPRIPSDAVNRLITSLNPRREGG